MSSTDPFEVLGLSPGAPRDEVRRAYRKLAMRWHPDRNQHSPASEERFKQIKAAYEIASDEAAYRLWCTNAAAAAATASRSKAGPAASAAPRSASGERAGSAPPIKQTLALTLEEVARGGRRTIRVERRAPCVSCAGLGRVDCDHSLPCQQCNGVGRRRGKGLAAGEKCPACAGRGYVRHVDCAACQGQGSTLAQSIFDVLVPVGMRHGETLRLARPGGSILLQIEHLPHAFFTVQGNDLHCTVPVDVLSLIAGGEIEVPTLDAVIRIPLPAASASAQFTLAGRGLPRRHGRGAGDLVFQLQAVFPQKLSASERTALRQLVASLAENPARNAPELLDWKTRLAGRKGQ
jgi:molecular chaperone DnaJ